MTDRDILSPLPVHVSAIDGIKLLIVTQPPSVWYNHGGKSGKRCIDLHIKLEGVQESEMDKILFIETSLLYESGSRVVDQSILVKGKSSYFPINSTTAQLELKITEVSSTHQKQVHYQDPPPLSLVDAPLDSHRSSKSPLASSGTT
jgi:hypothetical protein